MGGWMTFRRAEARGFRADDVSRMRTDYLAPVYPQPPFATRPDGSSPAEEIAAACGLPVETVRSVLRQLLEVQP